MLGSAVSMDTTKPFVGTQTPVVHLPGKAARAGLTQERLALVEGRRYAGRIAKGTVYHSAGWPLPDSCYGGSWIYAQSDTRLSIGFVTALDAPWPHAVQVRRNATDFAVRRTPPL